MSAQTTELAAMPREIVGKASRVLSAEGRLRAVVYGSEIEAMPITVDRREFERMMAHAAVGSTLVKLSIEGSDAPLNVIIKEIQTDPVKSVPQHVDFWAVRMGQAISTVVSVVYIGSSAGERSGGVVLHELRELAIEALPKDLPEHIEIDVSPLEVGDSLHVRDLEAPSGVTITTDSDAIVCSVTLPSAEEPEAEEGAEGAEVPEVGEVAESSEEA